MRVQGPPPDKYLRCSHQASHQQLRRVSVLVVGHELSIWARSDSIIWFALAIVTTRNCSEARNDLFYGQVLSVRTVLIGG